MSNIGKEFLKKTQYKYLEKSKQMQGYPPPPLQLDYDKNKKLIDLPKLEDIEVRTLDLRKAIQSRKSVRNYSDLPMTPEELSFLLWCTQGIKEVMYPHATLRTVPSAGARHAFETFLLINNVDTLEPGLYRYLALEHKLIEENLEPGIANQITDGCLGQDMVKRCGVTFIWVALPERMNWRYSERGYRYLHIDAGHVCQNLYLSAEALDCGVCAIAAFLDDKMNSILKLDGEEQFVIYLATVGKKKAIDY